MSNTTLFFCYKHFLENGRFKSIKLAVLLMLNGVTHIQHYLFIQHLISLEAVGIALVSFQSIIFMKLHNMVYFLSKL